MGWGKAHSSGVPLPESSSCCVAVVQGLATTPADGTKGGCVEQYNLRELSGLEKSFLGLFILNSIVCNS